MANWERINTNAPRVYRWKVDAKACMPLEFQTHNKIAIEVRNNKNEKPVEIYGSLFDAPITMVASTSKVNDILYIDPIRILKPKASQGVEIYVMGI